MGLKADTGRLPVDFLSVEERGRALKYRFQKDRHRFILSRCFLRSVLSFYLGQEPQDIAIEAGPAGKPRLKGKPQSGLRFNLAHSGDVAVVAVAVSREVGIDVELIRDPVPEPDAIRTYCSRRELAEIDALAGRDLAAAYYRIWTRKEALLKATGEGLGGLSPDLDVCSGGLQRRHGKTWHLYDLGLMAGYAAAIAVEGPACPIKTKLWQAREVLQGPQGGDTHRDCEAGDR
jgi:4'-phosphopantetheinyl transferase